MKPRVEIRRITVAVDASPASRGALEATVELAARLGAELLGVFVEDLDLLYATGLPFSAEVDVFHAALRRVDRSDAERRLRGQAARARALLEEVAGRTQVPWSFQVLRGRVASELRALAAQADLMSLSRGRHRRRLGSTAREVLAVAGPGRFLLLPAAFRPGFLAVLYDGSPAAGHALDAAAGLSSASEPQQEIVVLLPSGDEETSARLRREAEAVLASADVPVRFQNLQWEEARRLSALDQALGSEPGGLLVLPAAPWLESEALVELFGRLDRAVLLVR